VHALFFSLFASRITTRLLLLVGLLVGVPSSYFANQYGSIVDVGMIQNFLETDRSPLRHYFRSTARLNSSQEIALR
jgi:glucan phosphoethanolaminetransferase (alkaline phosphatase superfamily)